MTIIGQEIIDKADVIANQILSSAPENRFIALFIPKMIDSLQLKNGIEIDSDGGKFAYEIMSKSSLNNLYFVDPKYNETDKKLEEFIKNKKVMIIRKHSIDASTLFADNSIDYININGDRSLEGIYSNLKVWVPKLRIAGFIFKTKFI